MRATIVWGLAALALGLAGCGGGDRRVDPTPHLLEFLRNGDPNERLEAANEFAAMEEIPFQAVPGLIDALADNDEEVRLVIVQILGKQKKRARKLVPALYKAQDREYNKKVKAAISQALKDLDAENVPVRKSDMIDS